MTIFKINEDALILKKLRESKEEMSALFSMFTEYCFSDCDEEGVELESPYTNEEADKFESEMFCGIHQIIQDFMNFGFTDFENQEERETIIRIIEDIQWYLSKIIKNSYNLEERYIVYNEIESRLRDIYEYVGLIPERVTIRF